MQAIEVHEFGGPEVLVAHEVPDPVAGPGQVVIALVAADVIYLDTLLRSGWGGEHFPLQPPYVPGGGGAGTVVGAGPGVDPGWVGRRVLARGSGGYAARMAADLDELVELPDGVGWTDAAALLHDGVTALDLLRHAPVTAGDTVLIAAAAGGAGSLLVQLATAAGARVVAAARGERKLALVRDLGAELTVDYSEDGWQHRIRAATGGDGVDVAFDGAGGGSGGLGAAAFETVTRGGRFVTYGTAGGGFTEIDPARAADRRVAVTNALATRLGRTAVRELLADVLALAAVGRLRPVIAATHPLDRAADAHAALEARTTAGKSLLLI